MRGLGKIAHTAALGALAASLALAAQASAQTSFAHLGGFSGPGPGPGQLDAPKRLAVHDATGHVYVADQGNSRVQLFDPDGGGTASFLTEFDGGVLDSPYGIAIDQTTGDVYVSDPGAEEVFKFNSDGAPTPAFTLDPGFTSPLPAFGLSSFAAPLAVDPDGDLLVADAGSNEIKRFGSDGGATPVDVFDGATSGEAFTALQDLTVDSDGEIIVADGQRVERFDVDGDHLAALAGVPNPFFAQTGVVLTAHPVTGEVLVSSKSPGATDPGRMFQFEDDALVGDFGVANGSFGGVLAGLAIDGGDSGRLYVATDTFFGGLFGAVSVQVFDPVVLPDPPSVGIDAVDPDTVTDTEATFAGSVDHSEAQTSWRFEYVTEDEFQQNEFENAARVPDPDGELDGTEELPVEVEATADDLEPNTDYKVRLVASNSGGTTSSGPETFTTDAAPPVATTERATFLAANGATLRGRINPRNSQTTYHFDFGLDTSYGNVVPIPDGNAGAGGSPVAVTEHISGLEPDTIYHFRLVAENDTGRSEGADRTFTTLAEDRELQPARTYELVSPAETNAIDVRSHPRQISADGERAAFFMAAPIPGTGVSTQLPSLVSLREPGGWRSVVMNMPVWPEGIRQPPSNPGYPADLSLAINNTAGSYDPDDQNVDPDDVAPPWNVGEDVYLRRLDGGTEWVSRDPRSAPGTPQQDPASVSYSSGPAAASHDGSTIVMSSNRELADEHPAGSEQLYVWRDRTLRLAGVLPDGTVPTAGSGFNRAESRENLVSRDGSRIVFESPALGGGRLYVRMVDAEQTVEASARFGVPDPGTQPRNVEYAGANEDLTRVFFTSRSRLTTDSGASDSTTDHADLYTYDVGSAVLQDLTPRLDGADDPAVDPDVEDRARVQGVLAVSGDGRRVYFVATGELPAEPSPTGETPSPEGRNLYLAEVDEVGGEVRTRFVAALAADDSGPVWIRPFADRQLGTSPDGSVLGFTSVRSLSGEPTGGARQVYVYDAEANALRCASCPGDDSPSGDAGFFSPGLPLRPPTVAADGTVLFETPERLAARDSNAAIDVYEHAGGELRLVSRGTGAANARLGGISVDGRTTFFTTREALVPQDNNPGVRKVYAARVGGGFAAPPPPSPPCLGDDCKGAPPAPPQSGDPGSRGASGPANLADNRFAFGRVKKNRRRAKARLTVRVPGPGDVELDRNRKVKRSEERARSRGRVRLQVEPTRWAKRKLRQKKRRLRRRGKETARAKVGVRIRVTFSPEGGEPRTKTRRLRLVKR